MYMNYYKRFWQNKNIKKALPAQEFNEEWLKSLIYSYITVKHWNFNNVSWKAFEHTVHKSYNPHRFK